MQSTPLCPRCGRPLTTSSDYAVWCTADGCQYGKDDPRRMIPEPDSGVAFIAERDKKQVVANGFEVFWKAYPRKTAKATAKRAWNKLMPDAETLKAMLLAIEWQSQTKQWLEDGIIPHPATWLNQRRWEDEPPTAIVPVGPRVGPQSPPPAKSFADQERDKSESMLAAIRNRQLGRRLPPQQHRALPARPKPELEPHPIEAE